MDLLHLRGRGPFAGNLGSGQPYIYAHLPIVVSIVVISVGMKHAISQAAQPALSGATLRLIGAGITLWLVAFLALMLGSVRGLPLRRSIATCAAAVVASLSIAALGAYLPPPLVIAGIALIFVALVVVEEYSWISGRHGLLPNWNQADETPEHRSTEKR